MSLSQSLLLTIFRCRDLPNHRHSPPKAYCTVRVDGLAPQTTTVSATATCNPIFNHNFPFNLSEAQARFLEIEVWDFGDSSPDFLASCKINIDTFANSKTSSTFILSTDDGDLGGEIDVMIDYRIPLTGPASSESTDVTALQKKVGELENEVERYKRMLDAVEVSLNMTDNIPFATLLATRANFINDNLVSALFNMFYYSNRVIDAADAENEAKHFIGPDRTPVLSKAFLTSKATCDFPFTSKIPLTATRSPLSFTSLSSPFSSSDEQVPSSSSSPSSSATPSSASLPPVSYAATHFMPIPSPLAGFLTKFKGEDKLLSLIGGTSQSRRLDVVTSWAICFAYRARFIPAKLHPAVKVIVEAIKSRFEDMENNFLSLYYLALSPENHALLMSLHVLDLCGSVFNVRSSDMDIDCALYPLIGLAAVGTEETRLSIKRLFTKYNFLCSSKRTFTVNSARLYLLLDGPY